MCPTEERRARSAWVYLDDVEGPSSIEVASLAVKPMSKPLCGVQSLFEPETQDKPAGKEPYKPLRDLPESISQNRCEYPFLTSFTFDVSGYSKPLGEYIS
jgi:hypothetical protein